MKNEIKTHPLNVKGKYYVDQNSCLIHGVCELDAPNNFKIIQDYDSKNFGAYVFKQPENEQEESDCETAVMACPMFAVHNDGE